MAAAVEEMAGRFERAPARPWFVTASRLRFILIAGDLVGLLLGAMVALNFTSSVDSLAAAAGFVAFTVGGGLLVLRAQGLFRTRVSSIRVLEITRLTRSMGIFGFVLYGVDRVIHFGLRWSDVVTTVVVAYLGLIVSRACYRAWVGWARQSGRFLRKVMIIGSNVEAARMVRLFDVHREVGVEVVGVLGDRGEAVRSGLGPMWRGPTSRAAETALAVGASGVIVCPGAVPASELSPLIRSMHSNELYVHLGLGVGGFDVRRLKSAPLAYEPLMFCEPLSINRWGLAVKRGFDVVSSLVAIVLASPVMLAIAIAIRLDDGEPVLFRQQRVGFHGNLFGVLKFRTMMVDAEARLAELLAENERKGPLFKMERDPRVTRVGRFLRASSLDELPQLFNVLKGEMSLIGPRPALPSEVATFSDEVRMRENVRPGITGLWQVEARDNPSFDAYQRLDSFYLENWSLLLDLVILIGTFEQVCMRFVGSFLKSRRDAQTVEEGEELPVTGEIPITKLDLDRDVDLAATTGDDTFAAVHAMGDRRHHRRRSSTARLNVAADTADA